MLGIVFCGAIQPTNPNRECGVWVGVGGCMHACVLCGQFVAKQRFQV